MKEVEGWMQNVENIFTEEELKRFVKDKFLEIVKIDGIKHYIKYGSQRQNYKRTRSKSGV